MNVGPSDGVKRENNKEGFRLNTLLCYKHPHNKTRVKCKHTYFSSAHSSHSYMSWGRQRRPGQTEAGSFQSNQVHQRYTFCWSHMYCDVFHNKSRGLVLRWVWGDSECDTSDLCWWICWITGLSLTCYHSDFSFVSFFSVIPWLNKLVKLGWTKHMSPSQRSVEEMFLEINSVHWQVMIQWTCDQWHDRTRPVLLVWVSGHNVK